MKLVVKTSGWEKESMHRPAPVQNFSLQKKMGSQRKDFGGGFGFPGFYRVFVSTTGSFSSRPEKFSKRFSFGGGCVRFFSSLHLIHLEFELVAISFETMHSE